MKRRPTSSRLTGLGFEFAAAVAGFCLVGYWIGRFYDNGRLGLVIGAVLGLIGGMYNLLRATLAAPGGTAEQEQKPDSDSDG